MDWHFIIGPVVGAVIGLVTNGIALKMIFRPLYPKYIGKWKIPFTPGLIPKERGRLAKSIGNAISVNLMSPEVLEKTLLSEEMTGKVSSVIDGFFSGLAKETRSLREYLYDKVTERDTEKAISSVREEVCTLLVKKLSDPHIGDQVSHMVIAHVLANVSQGLMGAIGADRFINMIAQPAEQLLAKNINSMLSSSSEQMIWDIVEKESDKFLDRRVCDIVLSHQSILEDAKQSILSAYEKLVSTQLPRILETIDISAIVENRINEMDVHEVEQLVFNIMNKELNAIVWLGGLLGFLMGFLNI